MAVERDNLRPLQALISERDSFEAIRDQITALIAFERDNQKSLAPAGRASEWDFRLYCERSLPWQNIVDCDDPVPDDPRLNPIVNVWFDSDSFSAASSNVAETQKCTATYNVDVYGFGAAVMTDEGHMTGDQVAVMARDRVARLVRQILMSAQNAYLQLPRGMAWDRKIESRQAFQPQEQQTHIECVAMRMRFAVSFNETGPQYQGVPLDSVAVKLYRRPPEGEVELINVRLPSDSDTENFPTAIYDYDEGDDE